MTFTVGILGVPLSVFNPNDASKPLDQLTETPRALRAGGLLEVIRNTGATVKDFGDVKLTYNKNAKTFDELKNAFSAIATATERAARASDFLLVLGGGCTLATGTLRALHKVYPHLHLLWFDSHADFETPESTHSHYLGGMSLAHVVGAAGDPPILKGEQVTLLSGRAANWAEISTMREFGVKHCPPENMTEWLQTELPPVDLYIHFDVDVLELSSMPAVDIPYLPGVKKAEMVTALKIIAASKKLRGLELTVYNPYRDVSDIGLTTILQLVETCVKELVTQQVVPAHS
ncbi:arginase family protein [Sulfoacidibacillus thermotolerans]|uniref:Arginase n=1 Tax=Sulfoacidibacillus thermotolerans TaxID=1765684 RepID=A0A2U3DBV6_SULT2|nr:arginase family protein [Sulfoacidibacillus thermotolerans]PWI58760.1 hypothetical protein BM613_01295 [Sulfoacidibacillus thermotolerans]